MSDHCETDRATFTAMTESTQTDWQKIAAAANAFNGELPNRVLAHLQMLKGDCGGFSVDRLEHSLQSASLAYRDRMDEEYVVCALLHDMGDILASTNHAELAATILEALRRRGKLVAASASRHLPGLLLLSSFGARSKHARAVSRPSEFRAHRAVLRAPRSKCVRLEIRHAAVGILRADGAAGDGPSQAFHLPARGTERVQGAAAGLGAVP